MLQRKTRLISTVAATVTLALALGGAAAASPNDMRQMGDGAPSGGSGHMGARTDTNQTRAGEVAAQQRAEVQLGIAAQVRTVAQSIGQTVAQTATQTAAQQRTAAGDANGAGFYTGDAEMSRSLEWKRERLRDERGDGSGLYCPKVTPTRAQTSAMMR